MILNNAFAEPGEEPFYDEKVNGTSFIRWLDALVNDDVFPDQSVAP